MSDDEFFGAKPQRHYINNKTNINGSFDSQDRASSIQRKDKNIFSLNNNDDTGIYQRNQGQDINDWDDEDDRRSEGSMCDSDSGLSEISNEDTYFENKIGYQRRALFRKNATLQWRQKCTNIFQIITPIMGLFIIMVMEKLGITVLEKFSDKVIYLPIPYIFNLDYKGLANLGGDLIKINTCDQWYMYSFNEDSTDETKEFWGYNEGEPWYNPKSSGMLKATNNILNFPCNDIQKTVPYFREFNTTKYTNYSNLDDYLYDGIAQLHTSDIQFQDKDFYSPARDFLPDGAFQIKEANPKKLKYNVQVNDCKYWQYHRDNGVTKIGITDKEEGGITQYIFRVIEGQISTADLVNQAYMRTLFNDTTVVSGVQYFPFSTDFGKDIERGVSVMGAFIFPVCMCMGLPVFLYFLVLEKETRLTETMKINGMRMYNYWIVNFVFNIIIYCVTATVFVFFGAKVFKMQLFAETSLALIIFVLLGWGLAQISMAFFISVFLNKAQTASILGYTLSIWFTTVAVALNATIYSPPYLMDWFLYPIPTFTFCRAIYNMCTACAYENCITNVGQIPQELKICISMLYISFIVYMLLALYLYQVVPQTYGVPKPWNFLCNKKYRNKRQAHRDTDEIGDLETEREQKENPVFDFDLSLEDADSKAERNMVYNLDKADYYKYPLIIKDLRKVYPGFGGRPPKAATKNFCLRIKKGEMFGLLGPNGAGKTTLISILTGLYRPNSGNAWVAGYDIKDQLDSVQLQIGVCPQFDVLWADLTVAEHLYFYARLKGISPDKEDAQVEKAIDEVLLGKFKNFKVKQLSGGMKRRLSVAISLVSDPKIIYLDEPSTGLDPENRRQLWDILSACRGKRAIVLTTHSMEEADVLCNRIGIVNDGILRCVGPQVRLKSIYGGGYHLFVNCQKGKVLQLIKDVNKRNKRKKLQQLKSKKPDIEIITHPMSQERLNEEQKDLNTFQEEEEDLDVNEVQRRVMDFIKQQLPNSILIREFNGNFVYQIPLEGFKAERLFIEMERNRDRLRITDWGISQCSLEDVFSRICEH